jgi:cell division protein FtsB
LSKGANIYWDESHGRPVRKPAVKRRRQAAAKPAKRRAPWWLSFLIVTSIFAMLAVSINFRAFAEMREEVDKHAHLSEQIQNLMDENLALQEEIHSIRTDPRAIEREARALGMDLRREKVPMPVN